MRKFCLFVAPTALALVACDTMNAPLASSSFDPLGPPGSSTGLTSSYGPEFSPGQFVSAAIDNTAFYKNEPKGNEDADKLIGSGTQMKIVSVGSSYLKVELDSGEVGYVPTVMISSGESGAGDLIPVDGIYQVYPPFPDTGPVEPLPIIDPSGLPPEGSIPAIIDPDAPIDTTALKLDTIPEVVPAPDEPTEVSEGDEGTVDGESE
jgi:hypothetical protein